MTVSENVTPYRMPSGYDILQCSACLVFQVSLFHYIETIVYFLPKDFLIKTEKQHCILPDNQSSPPKAVKWFQKPHSRGCSVCSYLSLSNTTHTPGLWQTIQRTVHMPEEHSPRAVSSPQTASEEGCMVWGCFTASGQRQLDSPEETMKNIKVVQRREPSVTEQEEEKGEGREESSDCSGLVRLVQICPVYCRFLSLFQRRF